MTKQEFVELGAKIITSPEIIESLKDVKSDSCPTCGRSDCTWALIDKFLISQGGVGLKVYKNLNIVGML